MSEASARCSDAVKRAPCWSLEGAEQAGRIRPVDQGAGGLDIDSERRREVGRAEARAQRHQEQCRQHGIVQPPQSLGQCCGGGPGDSVRRPPRDARGLHQERQSRRGRHQRFHRGRIPDGQPAADFGARPRAEGDPRALPFDGLRQRTQARIVFARFGGHHHGGGRVGGQVGEGAQLCVGQQLGVVDHHGRGRLARMRRSGQHRDACAAQHIAHGRQRGGLSRPDPADDQDFHRSRGIGRECAERGLRRR